MVSPTFDPIGILGQVVAEHYRIERFVSQGGFSAVYRAHHVVWQRPAAIKFFTGLSSAPADQRAELERAFIREGEVLTELSSQSAAIVQARDVGTWVAPNGQWLPFLVLEWLDGLALDEVIERERSAGNAPWTLQETYALLAQVATALDIAHARGIAHRDVKPANLFLLGDDSRTGGVAVKILDFGVAKIMADRAKVAASLATTGTGVASFTPHYGAPEQFSRSHGATGPWTDVFALALVGVELLTFRSPLVGDDYLALGFAASNPTERPTPRRSGIELPDAAETVFQKALAVSPADRYANAGEFLEALSLAMVASVGSPSGVPTTRTKAGPEAGAASLPSITKTPAPMATPPTSVSRKRIGIAAGGIVGVAGLAALLVTASRLKDEGGPHPVAGVARSASTVPVEPTCPDRMARIPAGEYFRGSDAKDAPANQRPAHHVTLETFCIDLYEVTASEYKTCSDAGRCKRAASTVDWPKITPTERTLYSKLCTVGQEGKGDYPANCVTWEMAEIFCRQGNKRLPSEAEWEYAARGPDGRTYPWGDEQPTAKHLNACGRECATWARKHRTSLEPLFDEDDGFATLAPVGRYEAGRSRFGPYDVVGNVWEWVADYYADYTPGETRNPTGPTTGERKVIRGGGWNGGYESWLHPAFRYAQVPDAASHGIGFRCAKALRVQSRAVF